MPLAAAYIVPHPPLAIAEVGRGEERKISATLDAFHEAMRHIASVAPDRVVIISPHSAYYSDWVYLGAGNGASGDMGDFRAPGVSFSLAYDTAFRDELVRRCDEVGLPAGCVDSRARALDHGMMVPLYFLDRYCPSDSCTALSVGGSGIARDVLFRFGRILGAACDADEGATVLIASGDLSHKLKADGPYGFDEAGPEFDRAFCEVVTSGDTKGFMRIDPAISEPAAECGLSGFIMLAGALEEAFGDGSAFKVSGGTLAAELLSYEGPFGVGYGVAAFEPSGETAEEEERHV